MSSTTLAPGEPNPQLVWDTFNAYQRTAALRAAIELDLFTAIGEGATTAEALAQRCNGSQRGMRTLCDYLTVGGLLSKNANTYALTPTSAAFLDRHSPACMASMMDFMNSPELTSCFADLTETVRRGGTIRGKGVNEAEFDAWVTFAKSMMPLMKRASEFIAEETLRAIPFPRRVLDIAAGHGLFGIAVASKAPQAQIVAQDWPNVLEVAQANARSAEIADRYQLLPGDAFRVEFGAGYDVVLLTNFLHHFSEADCVALLKRVAACLNPGGRVMILEFVPNEDRISPPIPATFSLMMLGATQEGDAYTMREYERMFAEAGLRKSELKQVPQSPQQLIIANEASGSGQSPPER